MFRALTEDQRDRFDAQLKKLRDKRGRVRSKASRREVQAKIDAVKDERKATRKAARRERRDAGDAWWQRAARAIRSATDEAALLAFLEAERDDVIGRLQVVIDGIGDGMEPDALADLIERHARAQVKASLVEVVEQADVWIDFTAIPWPPPLGVVGVVLEALDGPLLRYIANRHEDRLIAEIVAELSIPTPSEGPEGP